MNGEKIKGIPYAANALRLFKSPDVHNKWWTDADLLGSRSGRNVVFCRFRCQISRQPVLTGQRA